MAAFVRVNPGDPMQAHQLNQVIDALDGAAGAGVPIAVTAVNDSTNYALQVQNDDATNSRALLVQKSDGTTLIQADVNGVVLALANGSVHNAALASDVARTSQLANGGFEIWQRGNGPFTTGVGSWSADRWLTAGVGGDTISISRDTTNVDSGSGACAAVTFTKATGTTGITNNFGTDGGSLVGRSLSASIRIRTATANAVRIGIYNGSAWTYSSYHTGSGAYQTLSLSGVTPVSNNVQFGVWFDVSCTAYLDNACLVVGSQPADYVPLHPADDLARCLRYYEVIGVNGYIGAGAVLNATLIRTPLIYKAQKAVVPTITFPAAASIGINDAFNPTAIAAFVPTVTSSNVALTVSGQTTGQAAFAAVSGGQLSIEANP